MKKVYVEMLEDRRFSDADNSGRPLAERLYNKGKSYELSEVAAKHIVKAGWAKIKKLKVENKMRKPSKETENKSRT